MTQSQEDQFSICSDKNEETDINDYLPDDEDEDRFCKESMIMNKPIRQPPPQALPKNPLPAPFTPQQLIPNMQIPTAAPKTIQKTSSFYSNKQNQAKSQPVSDSIKQMMEQSVRSVAELNLSEIRIFQPNKHQRTASGSPPNQTTSSPSSLTNVQTLQKDVKEFIPKANHID
ncbi:MAG: hypothetical protein EZS28_009133 [Streblomastix strix]|uniref:Uncharacterized protein n=1 Tax=Streblomastix strix TaxID=222440 RepID=A0A5J4WKJ9_9EUKA|nr:MAG: hypothetical protein EZS28_009133 [Streblomastix strix]